MTQPTPEEQADAMSELKVQIVVCPSCRFNVVVRDGNRPETCPGCRKSLDGTKRPWRGRPPGSQQKPPRGDNQFPW